MNLADMRTIVRRDLHDEDAASYRWSDDELDRHIAHAVKELSQQIRFHFNPVYQNTADSREIDISSISDRIKVTTAEYPTAEYPPSYVRFSVWGDTLTMLIDKAPEASGEDVDVRYGKLHTLDAGGSTIPAYLEDVVAIGAEGYAAVEWASYATNRVNVGGQGVERDYAIWGGQRLREFKRQLKYHSRRTSIRTQSLQTPQDLFSDEYGQG